MLRFFILLYIILSWSVQAKELLFINGSTPSGGQAIYSKELIADLEVNGFYVSLKTLNANCALAKNMWNSSTIPTIFILSKSDGYFDLTSPCHVEINEDNFLYRLNRGLYSFCSIKEVTWDDFIKEKTVHTVVVTPDKADDFIQELGNLLGKKIKTIRVQSYNDAMLLVKAKEVDYIFRNSIHLNSDLKDKCWWNHLNIEKILPSFSFKNSPKALGDEMILLHKNMTSLDVYTIRQSIKETMLKSIEIKKQIENRGQIIFNWNSLEELKSINSNFFLENNLIK